MAKVKVRIALAVDPLGVWSSCGWGDEREKPVTDDELMGNAIDMLGEGEARYFLEAEVDIPEPSATVIAPTIIPA